MPMHGLPIHGLPMYGLPMNGLLGNSVHGKKKMKMKMMPMQMTVAATFAVNRNILPSSVHGKHTCTSLTIGGVICLQQRCFPRLEETCGISISNVAPMVGCSGLKAGSSCGPSGGTA